jgi:hypothetical protein
LLVLLPSTSAFPDVLLQMGFEEVCIVLKSLVYFTSHIVTRERESALVFFVWGDAVNAISIFTRCLDIMGCFIVK